MRSALAAGGAAHRPGGARQAVLAARAAALSSALFSVRGSAASPPPPGGGGSAQGAAPVRAAAGAHRRVSSRAASAATPSCPQPSAPNTRASEPAPRRARALKRKCASRAGAKLAEERRQCSDGTPSCYLQRRQAHNLMCPSNGAEQGSIRTTRTSAQQWPHINYHA